MSVFLLETSWIMDTYESSSSWWSEISSISSITTAYNWCTAFTINNKLSGIFLMQQQTVFSWSMFFSKGLWSTFHFIIQHNLTVFHLVKSEAQSWSTFSYGFLSCSLQIEISLHFLIVFIILNMVVSERLALLRVVGCDFALMNVFCLVVVVLLTMLVWLLAQNNGPWSYFTCKDWDSHFVPKDQILTCRHFTCLLWPAYKTV